MAVRAGIVVRHSVDEPRLGIPGTWAATEMGDSGHRTQHLAVHRATGHPDRETQYVEALLRRM
jgi:hypothetical protein